MAEQVPHRQECRVFARQPSGRRTRTAGGVASPSSPGSATYCYDTYGRVTAHTGSASTPLQYGGSYTDAESGLIYLQARYYDPSTGQFLTVDPLVAQTLAPYDYVSENPLNASDPMGLCAWFTSLTSAFSCG